MDFYLEDFLEHGLADAFGAHDEFKHVVVLDGEVLPGFVVFHDVFPPICCNKALDVGKSNLRRLVGAFAG